MANSTAKTNLLFEFKDLENKQSKIKKQIQQVFNQAGKIKPVEIEIDTKTKRNNGISFKEIFCEFADSQTVIFKVKQSGDIFEVLLNKKILPIANQDNHRKAVGEVITAMEKGRTAFQKKLAKAKVALPPSVKSTIVSKQSALDDKKANLLEAIQAVQSELDAVNAEIDTLQKQLDAGKNLANHIQNIMPDTQEETNTEAQLAREENDELERHAENPSGQSSTIDESLLASILAPKEEQELMKIINEGVYTGEKYKPLNEIETKYLIRYMFLNKKNAYELSDDMIIPLLPKISPTTHLKERIAARKTIKEKLNNFFLKYNNSKNTENNSQNLVENFNQSQENNTEIINEAIDNFPVEFEFPTKKAEKEFEKQMRKYPLPREIYVIQGGAKIDFNEAEVLSFIQKYNGDEINAVNSLIYNFAWDKIRRLGGGVFENYAKEAQDKLKTIFNKLENNSQNLVENNSNSRRADDIAALQNIINGKDTRTNKELRPFIAELTELYPSDEEIKNLMNQALNTLINKTKQKRDEVAKNV